MIKMLLLQICKLLSKKDYEQPQNSNVKVGSVTVCCSPEFSSEIQPLQLVFGAHRLGRKCELIRIESW